MARVRAAALARPAKVAVHPAGLVVADTGHQRVLVVSLAGRVEAEYDDLAAPHGVRAEADGSIVVCERDAGRVVRIDAATGVRRVVLDDLASPWDLALGPTGEVFVADAGRHRIWRVTADGAASILAGTGDHGIKDGYGPAALFDRPCGLAFGPQGLFVVDAASSALRVVDAQNRVATLIGPAVRLRRPEGVAAAPDGYSIYVADTFNSSIGLWSGVDGEFRTAPVSGLLEPGGLDVLADGRLAVADTGNNRIVLVDLAAGTVEALPLT